MFVGIARAGNGISLIVALGPYVFTQLFVVYFVAIFAFYGRTHLFGKFHLCLALYFDGIMGKLHGSQQIGL